MRSRYSSACCVVRTGGLRLGITIARAKRRALSASTEAMAGPSRRCRCQSSGRFSVSRSISRILLGALERPAVQNAPWNPGNARSEPRRLARRQSPQQLSEHAFGLQDLCGPRLARREHQHELALLAMRIGEQPVPRIAERQSRHVLEFLRQLASDHHFPRRAEALRQVLQRFEHAVRRFIQDHRPGQVEAVQRLAPRRAASRQKSRKEQAPCPEPGRREGRHRRARPWNGNDADACAMRLPDEQRAGIGQRGRAGIADQRHILARVHGLQKPGGGGALVVLVQCNRRRRDGVPREQRAAGSRVLAGDQVGGAQRLDRARAGVAQVADRRGDDVEAAWDHPVNGGSCSFVKPAMNWAGARAEDLCAGLLKAAGLRLIERNWRCRMGEIDLIAEESGTLVFAEVRMRQSGNYGGAAESVRSEEHTSELQSRLHLVCRLLLEKKKKHTLIGIYYLIEQKYAKKLAS